LRPGRTGCATAGNPVPLQAGHLCSVGFAAGFFIAVILWSVARKESNL
jgi:hypothetical protein